MILLVGTYILSYLKFQSLRVKLLLFPGQIEKGPVTL